MSATVVKLPTALSVSSGKKLVTDPMYLPQTLFIHDFGNPLTYPSQANPVPINTSFVNLTPTNSLKTVGFKTRNSTPYNSVSKSLSFTIGSGTGQELDFGGSVAPFPDMGFSGAVTDLLFFIWIKISHPSGVTTGTIVKSTTNLGSAYANCLFAAEYGLNSAGKIAVYGMGLIGSSTPENLIPYTADTWMLVSLYHRCQEVKPYPNNSGILTSYKNGAEVYTRSVGTTAYAAIDNTRITEIGGYYGGANMEVGRFGLVKDLLINDLDPAVLIASEWNQFRSNYGI